MVESRKSSAIWPLISPAERSCAGGAVWREERVNCLVREACRAGEPETGSARENGTYMGRGRSAIMRKTANERQGKESNGK